MNTYVNPDTLNIIAKDRIAGMHQHAEIANQAKVCWALRVLSFNLFQPSHSAKAASLAPQTRMAHS